MKKEWRKLEKHIYLPKAKPEFIEIPTFQFFTIKGKGNPNKPFFEQYISVLYTLSYAVRMSYKWDNPPSGYYEYTVYPLEGVWDIADKDKYIEGVLDKDNLTFELMIRQPNFVTDDLVSQVVELTKKKKPHELLDQVEFKTVGGSCVQMLHVGPYDDEPESFKLMEQYCIENNITRISMKHREIYLSDPRKTAPGKLKTVLRFEAEKA